LPEYYPSEYVLALAAFRGLVMRVFLWGAFLIGFGAVIFWKPTIFRRGIWMKTSLAIRFLSEDNYRTYVSGLGIIYIVIGVALILLALSNHLGWHF
jgi:hypothetical protein